ncbi:MAG: hypothetical protein EKK64_06195 [Neisseriaceae bacterium]|nr:MAG: hypothetical protein EKK64_06195 [Neisseriaceae bacterium]
MGKVLLFSDLHIHPHKRKNERLEDCLKALEWVFEEAVKNGVKTVIFGGDLFHDRQKIEVYTYQRTFETLKKCLTKDINLYLLLGNHDLWFNDKTDVSSVYPLSSLPGVRVISKPERLMLEDSYWDFIPFTHDPINTLEELKKLQGKQEYAIGHIAVDGAVLHGSQYSDVAIEHDGDMVTISPKLFKDYKHTFLGHYHAEQRVTNKVEYIGSPLQLSFGEAFQEKHIILFDGETGEKKYIKNTFSPVHLIIPIEDKDKYSLEGNFVQIKVENLGSTDLLSMKKDILNNNNIGSLEIKQSKKKIDENVIQDARSILYKGEIMLSKFIEENPSQGLDKDILLEIGKQICQKEPK